MLWSSQVEAADLPQVTRVDLLERCGVEGLKRRSEAVRSSHMPACVPSSLSHYCPVTPRSQVGQFFAQARERAPAFTPSCRPSLRWRCIGKGCT